MLNYLYQSIKQYYGAGTTGRIILLSGCIMLVIFLSGCPAPPATGVTESDPLTDWQFTFLETENELYLAVRINSTLNGTDLDTAGVAWFGTNNNVSPDSIYLNDGGYQGDILAEDGIYARRISNSAGSLTNWISPTDSGLVYVEYFAFYDGETVVVADSFHLGNLPPTVIRVDMDTSNTYVALYSASNDTDFVITRPNASGNELVLVSAAIIDPNGVNDVSWVGFTSMHVGPDTLLNRGNLIYLYDDGGLVVLYLPDLTSGDAVADDGTFSFAIPIYGVQNNTNQTKTGLFRWSFQGSDQSGERSEIVTIMVVVQ
ncbi:MAG: hypothetical protein HQ528_07720 [Candidatus Marinimicrobia bacterium]|nr:hypothetical protein [Candidatus Neomarinimicrobiota bacterium]